MNVNDPMLQVRVNHPRDCTCGTKSCTASQWQRMATAVFAYVHHNQSVGALVVLSAETDFALRTDLLQSFGRKLAMQVAAENGFEGLARPWILDGTMSVEQVMAGVSEELGETVSLVSWSVQPGRGPLK